MKPDLVRVLAGFPERTFLCGSLLLPTLALVALTVTAQAADTGLGAIKTYLVTKVTAMDKASHDYVANAGAYEKIVQANGGDYTKAALTDGEALLKLIAKMQGDYRIIHNNGYETIEGVTAGTKRFVKFDNDLDAGVPKSDATTDTPASSLVLKTDTGKTIIDRAGNLFSLRDGAGALGDESGFCHATLAGGFGETSWGESIAPRRSADHLIKGMRAADG